MMVAFLFIGFFQFVLLVFLCVFLVCFVVEFSKIAVVFSCSMFGVVSQIFSRGCGVF